MDGNNGHDYPRPGILFNKHLETVFPAIFRKVNVPIKPSLVHIETNDGDMLEVDFYRKPSNKIVLISHGLEGNSQRAYVLGMVKVFLESQFNVAAWNYRGCTGKLPSSLRFYHSGATDDLELVCAHFAATFQEVYLVGFSLGGNLTLKYLGEPHWPSLSKVRGGVAVSAPLHLESSCAELARKSNWIYTKRFLRSLKSKVRAKHSQQSVPNYDKLSSVKSIRDFDEFFTSKLHGFEGASDYYNRCSAINFLSNIRVPVLILNALNDPFLSSACFPQFPKDSSIKAVYPQYGGHVGFSMFNKNGLYWSELVTSQFIKSL